MVVVVLLLLLSFMASIGNKVGDGQTTWRYCLFSTTGDLLFLFGFFKERGL
jgi:hypothetical protein